MYYSGVVKPFFKRLFYRLFKLFVLLTPESLMKRLMPYDWRLLRDSYEPLRSRADEYAARFYENFWKDYPETKALFGRNMPKQELDVRINHVMLFLAENAGRPKVFIDYLEHLAKRHKKYGIYKHQFEFVRETNIKTLNQLLSQPLTHEEEAAWRNGFDFITWFMNMAVDFNKGSLK